MIKAIFVDFDWTLYSHAKKAIPQSAMEAIRKAQANGIKVFLCTGRTKSALSWFNASDLGLDGYLLCNGEFIYDKDFKVIHSNYFQGKAKDFLVDLYKNKTVPIIFGNEEHIIMNFINDFVIETQKAAGKLDPEIKEYEGEEFGISHVYFKNAEERALLKPIEDLISVTGWNEYCSDVMSKGANKARAIEQLAKFLGYSMDEVMGIGDGHNDIEMIQKCGISVAMGNSLFEIKQYADYVTDDIDNNGLKKALEHYHLI